MKHFTPKPGSRTARAFLASLLSYLLLVGQFAPMTLAANSSAMRAAPAPEAGEAGAGEAQRLAAAAAAAPVAPFASTITAEKTDSFPDGDSDGKVNPGDDISYEVTVTNTGPDPAANVEFADTLDAQTTLVPGSVTMSPLARNDAYTSAADAPLTVNVAAGVLANDSGLPAPTVAGVVGCADATAPFECATAKGGTVSLEADGSFVYTPADPTSFTGTDSFQYTATNSNLPDDNATVTISFDPAAVDDSPTVAEDSGATTIDVLANDPDPDAGTKSIDSVTQPANGTVAITNSGADLTYEPDANYCNSQAGGTADTFTYTLTPGGDTATVSVSVTCSDDAPVGVDDSATVNEDAAAAAIDVLANDTDVEGDAITITAASDPANGSVVLTGPAGAHTGLTYQPDANYCNSQPGGAADTFTYTLNGGDTATVSVTVTCSDDDPTGVDDSATVPEDSSNNVINVLSNDTDVDGGDKFIVSATDPANGSVTLTGGSPGAHTGLNYTPDANYCNSQAGGTADTFTYTLTPGGDTATVSVSVTCSDDAPVGVDDSATVNEDAAAAAIDVLANDTDIDGGAKNITAASDPANGSVVLTGPAGAHTGLTYQPDANYCNDPGGAADTFTYTLNGGDTATVSVSVTCTNDAPTGVNDTLTDVLEDSAKRVIPFADLLGNDSPGPSNESGQALNITGVSSPTGGSVTINGTNVEFTPTANYFGPAGFTYTLSDDGAGTTGGPLTATATVSFNINGINDAPTFTAGGDVSVAEDSGAFSAGWATLISAGPGESGQTVSFGVTNDANALFTAGGQPAINASGTLTFTPAPNAFGTATVTVVASDNGGTANGGDDTADAVQFTITVTAVNDPPVAGTDTFETIGNTELRLDLADGTTPAVEETTPSGKGALHNDSDPVEGDPFQVTGIVGCADVAAPFDCTVSGQHIVMEADGKFSYIPAVGATSGTFQYTIADTPSAGVSASATGTVNITVHDMVWYVNGSAAAGGTGRSDAPFNSFASLNGLAGAGDSDAPGHYIFVHASSVNGPIELEADQHLYGEGYGLIIPRDLNGNGSPTTLVPAGTQPTVSGGLLDAVRVTAALPSEIRGLSLNSGSSNAIDITAVGAYSGAATLLISGNTFTNSSGQTVDVNSGAAGSRAITVENNLWSGAHAGGGIEVATTATATGTLSLDISGNSIVSNGTAIAIDGSVAGVGGSIQIVDFASNQVSGNSAGTGVAINTATFDATPGGAYNLVSGGDTDIGAVGNGVGGAGIVLASVRGDLSFTDLDVFADGGAAFSANSAAAFNAGGGTGLRVSVGDNVGTLAASAGTALSANQVQLFMQGLTLTSANGLAGVSLVNTDSSTVSAVAASTISTANASATAFRVDGSTGSYAYAGTINTTAGAGVNLTSNTGATIAFTGTLTISSGTSEAFTATGGGTVTATDINSTLTTTTASALNVANTTIGAGGLKFRSITSDGGGSAGIVLNNTGASGGLAVGGNGGTCSTAANCTGGKIVNKTVAGVSLNSTTGVSLTRMFLDNNDGSGVLGTNVTGFALANSVVTNNDNGVADGAQAGLRFTNLHGASSIASTLFQNQTEDHVRITNDASGSPNLNLSVTGSTFNINSATTGGHGIALIGTNTANMTLSVTGSSFDDILSTAVLMNVANTAKGNYTVSTSSFTDIGAAITLQSSDSADLIFNVSNNPTMLRATSNMIQVVAGSVSLPASQIRGTIANNSIGNGTVGSGHVGQPLPVQYGIAVDLRGDQDSIIDITGNTTRNTEWEGIWYSAADFGSNPGSPTSDITIRDNSVTQIDDDGDGPGGAADFPRGDIRGVLADFRHTTNGCLDLFGNTSVGSVGFEHFRARQRDTAVVRVERLTDGDGTPNELLNNAATIEANLAAQNDPGSTVEATFVLGFTEAADGTCRPVSTGVSGPVTFEAAKTGGALDMMKTDGAPAKTDTFKPATAGEAIYSPSGQLLRPARPERDGATQTRWNSKSSRIVNSEQTAPATGAAAPAAGGETAPAAPARVWSDMPVIINRAPQSESANETEPAEGEATEKDDAAEGQDAKQESDAAAPEKKPARRKPRANRTETYQEPSKGDEPAPARPEQPGVRNISYVGPLGSAPARGVRFTRASYTEAGERRVTATRTVKSAKSPAKARARTAPLAVAGETVNVTIGNMPSGKSVKIRFKATVSDPFTGSVEEVSNQGTVTADGGISVQTDDPTVGGGNDPTVTPVAPPAVINVRDAKVVEPTTPGAFADLLFTVTLSRNPTSNVTVQFATSDGTAVSGSGPQDDYVMTTGTLTFQPGQRVMTIAVPVRGNAPPESDETLTVTLTNPTGHSELGDDTATGTITETPAAPGQILISELRTSGPGGLGDDFVEIYNNNNSPVTVTTTDGSAGWGLFKMGADCDATPVLVGTIPKDTTILPGRGHYLFVGSQYSLKDYGGTDAAAGDQTLSADIESDANLALFNTADVANLSALTRLDAVGFGTNNQSNCKLLREGTNLGPAAGSTLEHSYFRKLCDFVNGVGCQSPGIPKDTQNNASDFQFADTLGTQVVGTGHKLGAPGPENLDSPLRSNSISVLLLDSTKGPDKSPNRVRDFTSDPMNNSTFGTLSIRRRVVNNTGQPVSRLRFRISEITTDPQASPSSADLRARTSGDTTASNVGDTATCAAEPGSPTPLCTVTLRGTTLEQPPTQTKGGGLNATLTVNLGAPLPAGESINVQFLLGLEQTGLFRFFVVTEALQ